MPDPNKSELQVAEIVRLASDGQGIAMVADHPVHVRFAAPGDRMSIRPPRKRRKGRRETTMIELLEAGSARTEPRCAHFGECGGCRLQHIDYGQQLRFKEEQVQAFLAAVRAADGPVWLPILGCEEPYEYRNKIEFSFAAQRWLSQAEIDSDRTFSAEPAAGFHPQGQFAKVLHVERCHLVPAFANQLRDMAYAFAREHELTFYHPREHHGVMRTLTVRQTTRGETMAIVAFGEQESVTDELLAQFRQLPQLSSLFRVVNSKRNDSIWDLDLEHVHGAPWIHEDLGGSTLRLRPKSFLQPNSVQARVLYETVQTFSQLHGTERVLDLYSGIGSITLMLARGSAHVLGIEEVPDAVHDARENASLNGVTNAEFVAAKVEDVLGQHTEPVDLVVLDPPRAGMHPEAVRALVALAPQRIVYVSCNPKSLARDLASLSIRYRCQRVQAVDMFPHTMHVETVVELALRP